jgi:hypothetical protein
MINPIIFALADSPLIAPYDDILRTSSMSHMIPIANNPKITIYVSDLLISTLFVRHHCCITNEPRIMIMTMSSKSPHPIVGVPDLCW